MILSTSIDHECEPVRSDRLRLDTNTIEMRSANTDDECATIEGLQVGTHYLNRAYFSLQQALGENVVKNKVLAKETSIRAGGPAAIFATADSFDQLRAVLFAANEWGLPLFVIGKGSNLLVSDAGFQGIVVRLGKDFMLKRVDGNKIQAGAAVSLPSLVQTSSKQGLDGMTFAVGIPGSLGGALVMNAGAHEHCIGDVVSSVIVFSKACELRVMEASELSFEYRNGNFNKDDIIVEATLELTAGDPETIKRRMEEWFGERKNNQPLQFPNAGSVFKNPKRMPAGLLIEKAGCKGMRSGDAEVSEKHANFIINRGVARASDVHSLIKAVQVRVFENTGVYLEPEIEFLGQFEEMLIAPRKS